MAVLVDSDRRLAWLEFMLGNLVQIGITKQDLRAAIDATDLWIDNNAASYNTALPLPARTILTTKQKAMLFMVVAARRYGVA